MTSANAIPILAVVTPNERAIVEAAASQLAGALKQATGEARDCSCVFVPDLRSVAEAATAQSVIVTSLLVPLARLNMPWAEIESELRSSYAALCETGNAVMICTALRHVESSGESDSADRTRRRLRQLDLLATELSREYGALVIDLDRTLAHIGARRLKTDYRLGGAAVLDVAANAIAVGIAANALDPFASVEIQDAARAVLESYRPAVDEAPEFKPADLIALGHGRRKQRVLTVTDQVQENHVGWLVRQAMKGQIGPGEALNRFVQAIRRRGARESASLLFSGIAQFFRPQT
jgi:hypothetical protein